MRKQKLSPLLRKSRSKHHHKNSKTYLTRYSLQTWKHRSLSRERRSQRRSAKAFRRLQEEIIRTSNDPSIFAFGRDQLLSVWEAMYERPRPMRKVLDAVLAESPDYFWQGGDVLISKDLFDEPYSITHMGLRVVTRSYKALRPDWLEPSGTCYAILVANILGPQHLGKLYLVIQQVRSGKEGYCIRVGVESCTMNPPDLSGLDWKPEGSRVFYIQM